MKFKFTFVCFYAIIMAMDTKSLTAVGLSPLQAEAYALLIEHGELKPPVAARQLKLTRTNAYKVLDKLVELKLARKTEDGKKLTYSPTHPMALADLASQYRAEATAREEAANTAMQSLLRQYYMHSDTPGTQTASGPKAVADLYRTQIALREDLYFIRTTADIPSMGFDTMHELRTAPSRHGNQRHGILSVRESDTTNPEAHNRSNLEVTWLERGKYTTPVEWSATESSLLMVIYGEEPQAILITNPLVGAAFIQIWQLLSSFIQAQPTHKQQTLK